MELSLIVPVYNETAIIPKLFDRIHQSITRITHDFEVIFVNDGSTDDSLSKLLELHETDRRYKVLDLSRNFGHQAAYSAGLSYAKGDKVVLMDGDLQDPPELIADMIKLLSTSGSDIVYGMRTNRKESFIKKQLILWFHKILTRVSELPMPANVGNYSVISRKAVDVLNQLQETNRYLPGLRAFIGFKQEAYFYERPDRADDSSTKMSYSKLIQLAFDALFSFSKLPIKICLIVGFLGMLFSIGGAIIVFYKKMSGDAITGWTSILMSIYFIGSVQLLFLGIIGEYIHRIFVETQNRPLYIVEQYID